MPVSDTPIADLVTRLVRPRHIRISFVSCVTAGGYPLEVNASNRTGIRRS
jgi:hypothetical protein